MHDLELLKWSSKFHRTLFREEVCSDCNYHFMSELKEILWVSWWASGLRCTTKTTIKANLKGKKKPKRTKISTSYTIDVAINEPS